MISETFYVYFGNPNMKIINLLAHPSLYTAWNSIMHIDENLCTDKFSSVWLKMNMHPNSVKNCLKTIQNTCDVVLCTDHTINCLHYIVPSGIKFVVSGTLWQMNMIQSHRAELFRLVRFKWWLASGQSHSDKIISHVQTSSAHTRLIWLQQRGNYGCKMKLLLKNHNP